MGVKREFALGKYSVWTEVRGDKLAIELVHCGGERWVSEMDTKQISVNRVLEEIGGATVENDVGDRLLKFGPFIITMHSVNLEKLSVDDGPSDDDLKEVTKEEEEVTKEELKEEVKEQVKEEVKEKVKEEETPARRVCRLKAVMSYPGNKCLKQNKMSTPLKASCCSMSRRRLRCLVWFARRVLVFLFMVFALMSMLNVFSMSDRIGHLEVEIKHHRDVLERREAWPGASRLEHNDQVLQHQISELRKEVKQVAAIADQKRTHDAAHFAHELNQLSARLADASAAKGVSFEQLATVAEQVEIVAGGLQNLRARLEAPEFREFHTQHPSFNVEHPSHPEPLSAQPQTYCAVSTTHRPPRKHGRRHDGGWKRDVDVVCSTEPLVAFERAVAVPDVKGACVTSAITSHSSNGDDAVVVKHGNGFCHRDIREGAIALAREHLGM